VAHAVLPRAPGQDAFPADPEFPQLEIATDLARMRDLFRIHLKPAGRRWEVAECAALRLRSRQSVSRCVLQYTLRVIEPDTGQSSEQWVSGLLYAAPGEAEQLCRELKAATQRHGIPDAALRFEPVGFIAELEMVLQLFPYDRKLPQLAALLAGPPPELTALAVGRLGPGEWRVEQQAIEPTRYRAELGAALRYTLEARERASGERRTVRCYLKVYRDERGAESYERLAALTDLVDAGPYRVVRPIAYLGPQRMLVLEEAPGTSLQQILLEGGDPTAALEAAARAVAAFSQSDPGLLQQESLAHQLNEVRGAARLVQWGCPELRPAVEAIIATVEVGLTDAPAAPIHGDLKTEHLFVSGGEGQVSFVDLDAAVLGDPVRDPAHLWAHIAGRLGLDGLTPERARSAADMFTEAYFRHVPAAWRARFHLHCAAALLEVARGIFKRQEPEWREKVAVAVREGHLLVTA
jgi:Phosphotransferase enzyme family